MESWHQGQAAERLAAGYLGMQDRKRLQHQRREAVDLIVCILRSTFDDVQASKYTRAVRAKVRALRAEKAALRTEGYDWRSAMSFAAEWAEPKPAQPGEEPRLQLVGRGAGGAEGTRREKLARLLNGDARRLAPSRAPRDARRRDRGASSAASSEADAAGSHSGSESDGDAIAAARPRARRGGIAPRDVLREARGSLL